MRKSRNKERPHDASKATKEQDKSTNRNILEVGSWKKLEVGNRKLEEVGTCWKLEALESWKRLEVEVGSWKLEFASWTLEFGRWNVEFEIGN